MKKFNTEINKIISLVCIQDYAGICYNLCEAVNRFTNWKIYHIIKRQHRFKYNSGIDINEKNNVQKIFNKSDVIISQSCFDWDVKKLILPYPEELNNFKIDKNTKLGLWHGGSVYRQNYDFWNKEIHPKCDYIFAHRDLEGLDNRIKRLQATIDVDKYFCDNKNYKDIFIGSSPSTRKDHGTEFFIDAIKQLNKCNTEYNLELIENIPNEECMNRKKKINLFFGEIGDYEIPKGATRGYGVSIIEAAAFNSVCIDWSNYKDTPIISVKNTKEILNSMLYFLNNKDEIQPLSEETRKWVINEHGYRNVANKFISDIEETINEGVVR